MNLALFGANGPTGRIVTAQALAAGHRITAVTRHPEAFPLHHDGLRVVRGDVFDAAAVHQLIAGHDAVVSSLGTPYSRTPITLYSRGTAHILNAMQHHGIRRFVCVSSSLTDPAARAHDTGGGFVFEQILKPLLATTVGRTLYADMQRMEALVMQRTLDWTIVRPSGLFDTPTVTPYLVGEGVVRGRFTARADLADCMLHQLTHDQYIHKVAAVATVAVQPRLLQLLVREAFGQQRGA